MYLCVCSVSVSWTMRLAFLWYLCHYMCVTCYCTRVITSCVMFMNITVPSKQWTQRWWQHISIVAGHNHTQNVMGNPVLHMLVVRPVTLFHFTLSLPRYTEAAVEWVNWVNTSPADRHSFYKDTIHDSDKLSAIEQEIKKIRCFNCILWWSSFAH